MAKKLSSFPFFLFFFSVYPGLSLLSWNIREVEWQIALRPILVTTLLMLLFLFSFQILVREWDRSALLSTVVLLVFFSYGHVYNIVLQSGLLEFIGKPNRILFPLYLGLIALSIWWIISRLNDPMKVIPLLNIVGAFLFLTTAYQIISYEVVSKKSENLSGTLNLVVDEQTPDIYYIILDAYNRADTLNELGFDNSEFIDFLRSRGFFVADCSRSNYRFTMNSVASALNMDFVYNFVPNKGYSDINTDPIIRSIRENRVRAELKSIGYTDISFNMGYKWATWWDADTFLPQSNKFAAYFLLPYLNSFEIMYLQTTLLKPLLQYGYFDLDSGDNDGNVGGFSAYRDHFDSVHYILATLPTLVSTPGPKLIFAHLMVPHPPFVFLPDGSFNPDSKFYEMIGFEGENFENGISGYLNGVQFINHRMMGIVDEILQKSEKPPIVILQADHGYISDDGKYNILNAYLLPEGGNDLLYPTITPINTFRVIFNYYFGTDFTLLEDMSISTDIGHPYSEKEVLGAACP